MTPDFQKLLDFIAFTKKFREVERMVVFEKGSHAENDMEHSYQLAITAWYLISTNKLNLTIDKVIRYALVHDLVEVYAGDTPLSSATQADKDSKEGREKAALEKIEAQFQSFPDMPLAIHEYEKRADRESRFVYALDKIIPLLNVYLDGGFAWKKNNMSLSLIFDSKVNKVALSPEIKPYFDEVIELLRNDEAILFNK